MREIKFRAWDKGLKMMLSPEQIMHIEFNKGGIHWIGGWVVEEDSEGDPTQALHQIQNENLELMQYAGLLDKNGKEIYEGDICNDGSIVTYVGGRYILNYSKNNEWEDLIGDEDEVIGNIYENPELLEVKKIKL